MVTSYLHSYLLNKQAKMDPQQVNIYREAALRMKALIAELPPNNESTPHLVIVTGLVDTVLALSEEVGRLQSKLSYYENR